MSNLGKKASDDDEVEQLLRAAQDDVLLKLTVNSHTARGSAIAPDLDRRFQALKKPQNLTKHHDSVKKPPKELNAGGSKEGDAGAAADDDLFTRFSALKNSLPSNNSNFTRDEEEEEDEEDEVEKVIRWATDAARLDPSPPSDDDDDEKSDDSSDDDDDDDHGVSRGKKSKRK